MKYAGDDWIEKELQREGRELSPLGREVADILGYVWRGIYHLDVSALLKVKWERDDVLSLRLTSELATYDGDELTALVILAHERAIRVAVRPAMRDLLLCFHRRSRDGGRFFNRHPSIEEAIAHVRAAWSATEAA